MKAKLRPGSAATRLKANARSAAEFLLALANDKRLAVLCELLNARELPVGELAQRVGLSQSALSQHLAKLRAEGLVETRRESQLIHYRLAKDKRLVRTLALLEGLFCG